MSFFCFRICSNRQNKFANEVICKNHVFSDQMKAYILQIRHETGERILDRVWDDKAGRPSKWWMCFAKRKFMEKSLSQPGR